MHFYKAGNQNLDYFYGSKQNREIMEIETTFESIRQFFLEPLLRIGSSAYSLWGILLFIFSIALLFMVTGWIKRMLVEKILTRYSIELGIRQSIGTIFKSDLYFAIFEKFKEHGVEIPYPQRDLHFKSGFEPLLTKP